MWVAVRLVRSGSGRLPVSALPVFGGLLLILLCGAASAAAETTVSLTFDDGSADHVRAEQSLAEHGMRGTFFVIPSRIGGESTYLTWAEIAAIYADGNEIGGHTVSHPDLTALSPDQQREEICGARQDLLARGYPQLSFAYPFGHYDATSEALAQECGYASARQSGGIAQYPAESIPPLNRWAIRTRTSVRPWETVDDLERSVMAAEAVPGSWLIFVFHRVCNPASETNCPSDWRTTPAILDGFLDWLQGRELLGTHVRTIGEVVAANPQPLFRVLGVRSGRNGTARLRVYVGCAGVLRLSGHSRTGGFRARVRSKIRGTTVRTTHAGAVTIAVRPSAAGRRALAKRRRLKALADATFTPLPGTSTSATVAVTLKRSRGLFT